MNVAVSRFLQTLLSVTVVIALPLAGVALVGKPVLRYFEFPPRTQYVEHAGFSWPVFLVIAAVALALFIPIVVHLARRWRLIRRMPRLAPGRMPWWGWAGVALGVLAWVLAWTRFPWFAPFQPHTFTPLWFAYVLVVNALTFRRIGRCPLTHWTWEYLLLFPLSAAFWWFFEYLNRFVQNWHYVGIENRDGVQYFLMATLPFSTVLPAVLGTYDLFASVFGRPSRPARAFQAGTRRAYAIAGTVLAVAGIGLACIGVLPDYLFPLLWISPLLVFVSVEVLAGRHESFFDTPYATWHGACLLAASALVCGFFWEMWNSHSLVKWIYTIPFISVFKVFEMPLVGYGGYFPFGLECAVVARLIRKERSA